LLAPAQFHISPLPDPDTWQAPAQNPALLEESARIGLDLSKWRGECPETRPAVARRARRVVAQVVWDCPRVTNWYNRQFPQDTLNQYYVQNRILVVKLVNNQ
jgi:hypothetical protein